jgi:hypothetical protein
MNAKTKYHGSNEIVKILTLGYMIFFENATSLALSSQQVTLLLVLIQWLPLSPGYKILQEKCRIFISYAARCLSPLSSDKTESGAHPHVL